MIKDSKSKARNINTSYFSSVNLKKLNQLVLLQNQNRERRYLILRKRPSKYECHCLLSQVGYAKELTKSIRQTVS